ncbi:DUF6134 family protein [Acidocella sp.]|uniref:DUF6134 family protein n=2 Tax=Acidocella sp. TaxID=50710 RepID=UPI00260AEE6A|nr:DUF6134 family protein [Acidocella sp.]
MNRRTFALGLAAAGVAGGARAAGLPVPPSGRIGFRVLRNGVPIGEHHLKFTQDGAALNVEINADLVVKVLGVPVFHYTLQALERWEGQSFVGLDSQVNHNGARYEVHAAPVAGGFAVRSTKAGDYVYTGQRPMMPLTYWNKAMLEAEILNVETGRHYPAIVNSPGWNYLPTAEGGQIVAQRFDVTGKLHLSVWYDQTSQWAGLAFSVDGHETFEKITA